MRVICFFSTLLFFQSCDFLNSKLSNSTAVKFVRFDEDLLSFDTNQFQVSEKKMIDQYGDIYAFYMEQLMGLGKVHDQNDPYYYKKFLPSFLAEEYPAMMDSCREYVIKDISKIESELTTSYALLNKNFPEKKPSVIYSFFISPMGANPQAAFSYGQDTIGINWFNYLGTQFSMYKPIYEGYSYMIEWNSKEYLTRNVMLVEYNLLYEKHGQKELQSELIYKMIEEGKKYAYLDEVCPDLKDEIKIGYNSAQMKWCQENEFEIWAHFKENKLIYSIETMNMKKYTEEGPTTSGMPAESPGMTGSYIGWQIVKKYMKMKNISLKELMGTTPKDIFTLSQYKPSK